MKLYCPPGSISKIQVPCGSSHQYCPEHSAYPTAVSSGHYTLTLSEEFSIDNINFTYIDTMATININNKEIIENLENASVGVYEKLYFYNSLRHGNQTLCEPGYYCLSDGK